MEILTFDQLPQGGFAGLIERQFVKDDKIFSPSRKGKALNGIGNFVYLADANFLPHGETGMHPHKELDVISIMVEGNIDHAGSLEHGKSLEVGQAQAQRAGSEGFSHNEINPDNKKNQLIQLWVLPESSGESARYKIYSPKKNQITTIYGGSKEQDKTLDSHTHIQMVNAQPSYELTIKGEMLAYISKGNTEVNGKKIQPRTLIRVDKELTFKANSKAQLIVISHNK